MNKLLANQKKAMSEPKPKTKSKVSPAPAAPMPSTAINGPRPTIAGLPSDRYYAAESAIRAMSDADKVRGDKRLQADVRKVAEHKMKELQSAMGGGRKR